MKMKQSAKKLAMWVVVAIMAAITPIGGSVALANGECDVTVTAPGSIQAAVNAASSGYVICLDGTFNQSVIIPASKSGITLTSASDAVLDGAALAGTGPTSINGITLASGVSGVTIEDLEIKNFKGNGGGNDRSSAIVAANGNTSNITVENNYLHDNFWNGILVWSNGGPANHTDWTVKENIVAHNGFVNIEVTNCDRCKVKENTVTGSLTVVGIVVQARNDGQGGTVTQEEVWVEENEVSGSFWGILAQAYGVSSGDHAVLENVTIKENKVDASGAHGIYVRGRAGATGTSTVHDVMVNENEVSGSGVNGIYLQEVNLGTVLTGNTVSENEVEGSGTLDCYDTTGTDNTWTDNEGATSSPAGLCEDE